MDVNEVLQRLSVLTDDTRGTLLTQLAGDAVARLSVRLCAEPEKRLKYKEQLTALAAAEAAYSLALLDEATAPQSLSAGDVRATFSGGSEKALAYRDLCERAAAPALMDESFWFGGVRA